MDDSFANYPELLAEWSLRNGRRIDGYTLTSSYKAWWICSLGHEWQSKIFDRTRWDKPSNCPQCHGYVPLPTSHKRKREN